MQFRENSANENCHVLNIVYRHHKSIRNCNDITTNRRAYTSPFPFPFRILHRHCEFTQTKQNAKLAKLYPHIQRKENCRSCVVHCVRNLSAGELLRFALRRSENYIYVRRRGLKRREYEVTNHSAKTRERLIRTKRVVIARARRAS